VSRQLPARRKLARSEELYEGTKGDVIQLIAFAPQEQKREEGRRKRAREIWEILVSSKLSFFPQSAN